MNSRGFESSTRNTSTEKINANESTIFNYGSNVKISGATLSKRKDIGLFAEHNNSISKHAIAVGTSEPQIELDGRFIKI